MSEFAQDEYDAFSLDNIEPDEIGKGGGLLLPAGGYLFSITEVILRRDGGGACAVECEVINTENASLLGRKHMEFLNWPSSDHADGGKTAGSIMLAWCCATKTVTVDELKARKVARQGFKTQWLEAMTGRHVLGIVKESEYQGSKQSKINGRVMAVDDPKGKGIPGWVDAGQAGQQQQSPPPAQQPADDNAFAGLV